MICLSAPARREEKKGGTLLWEENLRPFFRQLKHLSFARLKLHINAVHEETGKNRLAIFCDMVWCEVRYGIGYLDYHVFGFANRRGAVRKTYMTAVQNQALTRQMNDPAYFYQLNDKIEFDTIFSDLLKRRFLTCVRRTPRACGTSAPKHGGHLLQARRAVRRRGHPASYHSGHRRLRRFV